jgi:hypothetical protein
MEGIMWISSDRAVTLAQSRIGLCRISGEHDETAQDLFAKTPF